MVLLKKNGGDLLKNGEDLLENNVGPFEMGWDFWKNNVGGTFGEKMGGGLLDLKKWW